MVSMYVATVPNRSSPPAILLRESYREGARVKSRTLANLTKWAPAKIEALRRLLHGEFAGPGRVEFRPLVPSDRVAIRDLLVRCGNFRPDEMDVAIELVDESLQPTGVEDYHFVIAVLDGCVVGYSCFGPVPLTDGVWDLYWIAVDPAVQGHGVGGSLQAATERHIRSAGGRLVLAETSSLPSYESARTFYLHKGYQLLERIADFYRPGDDRLTFGKRLEATKLVPKSL